MSLSRSAPLRLAKYLRVMAIGFQNTLVYRWNFLLRVGFSFIPLMGAFFFWGAAAKGGGGEIGGYSFNAMISYFLGLMLLDLLASPTEDDYQIAAEIRDGLINQFLMKPVDYLAYRFSLFWSYRAIYAATTLVPVLAAIWYLRAYFTMPESWGVAWLCLVAVLLSATLQFLIAFTSALLAFWVLEVSAPIFIIYSFEFLAGGHVFPLDLFPPWAYRLIMLTPFPYEYWFPLGIFLGRFSPDEVARGFAMQAAWCLGVWLLARWVWARGIRRYTAVGG
ncbi:MAG: ABC-2 family transporter protein [Verrucomicrobiae bacterium]|nr:ABC-2 family transporter protein [Verrucomicrobiae bacterium]